MGKHSHFEWEMIIHNKLSVEQFEFEIVSNEVDNFSLPCHMPSYIITVGTYVFVCLHN